MYTWPKGYRHVMSQIDILPRLKAGEDVKGKRYFEWLGKHSGYSFMPRRGKYYLWPEYARKAFAIGSMQKNRSK